jgi:hypothetical protein
MRRSLLVAFLVLAFAASTYAECAWVLWVMTPRLGGGLAYRALDAFGESETACKEELTKRQKRARESGGAGQLLCLPDSVDPRGPKGK